MDSPNAKTIAYVLILLFVVAFLGLAFMKFNQASQGPTDFNPQTQQQKLDALEKSPGVTSPGAKNFIHNEVDRRNETRDAEKAVADPNSP